MWNTNPPRQVTAADEIRGVEAEPATRPIRSAAAGDFSDIIAGYSSFCNGFANVSATSASAQAAYINSHQDLGRVGRPQESPDHRLHPAQAGRATSRAS